MFNSLACQAHSLVITWSNKKKIQFWEFINFTLDLQMPLRICQWRSSCQVLHVQMGQGNPGLKPGVLQEPCEDLLLERLHVFSVWKGRNSDTFSFLESWESTTPGCTNTKVDSNIITWSQQRWELNNVPDLCKEIYGTTGYCLLILGFMGKSFSQVINPGNLH